MVEKMTAVWLILLTILVCAAVPGVLIWLTSSSGANNTNDNFTVNYGTVADADNDNVYNITDWTITTWRN